MSLNHIQNQIYDRVSIDLTYVTDNDPIAVSKGLFYSRYY